MKIGTQNRLAHYQVEFQELQEQTAMLNAQLPGLMSQLQSIEQYLRMNGGDRTARANYNGVRQRYNQTCTAIRRNTMRMQTLQRQIAGECNKAMYGRTGTRMPRRTYY